MSTEPESLIHRLLERMRAEHTAAMDAMMTELAATRRVFASMEGFHDKALRQVQGDVIALETQNIARHGEVLNILRRIDEVELLVGHEESVKTY